MGIINHNAVIATTWDKREIERIKVFICNLEPNKQELFLFSPEVINGYLSVVMAPDGSKESWSESDEGDILRVNFISEINKNKDYWYWIEVGFGEYGQEIIQGNCENIY